MFGWGKRKKGKVPVQLFANSGAVLGLADVMPYLCKEIDHTKVLSEDGTGGETWTDGCESHHHYLITYSIDKMARKRTDF